MYSKRVESALGRMKIARVQLDKCLMDLRAAVEYMREVTTAAEMILMDTEDSFIKALEDGKEAKQALIDKETGLPVNMAQALANKGLVDEIVRKSMEADDAETDKP